MGRVGGRDVVITALGHPKTGDKEDASRILINPDLYFVTGSGKDAQSVIIDLGTHSVPFVNYPKVGKNDRDVER